MTKTVAHLTTENDDLRARVTVLEGLISSDGNTSPLSKPKEESNGLSHNPESISFEEGVESERLDDLQQNTSRRLVNGENYDQRRKSIVRTPPSPTGVIAFHAYLSKDSSGPLPIHHVLTFDVVTLNKGQGYNAFDGIFVVPVAGTYVFTWSFMSEPHGTVYTQLMKNAEVIGRRYADSATASVWDFSTGVVVVDVAVGNHIYVRLGYESNGKVLSIAESKTSFSGWLLD
uniref:Complement C1q tumor necrosis factor-related protein 4-like n=1 Tax=Crassostrea virginica TaxID=6565 RepID=A0A8B8C954_CRAVI|nr:complement C1q tumor necrosis factor-related protein 4-like [Crassostrea virginica]